MPELPEVETVVRALRSPLVGRTFANFVSLWPRQIVRPDDPAEFKARLLGRTVTAVTRRAKYIVIHLDDEAETLLVHLKMTGHLAVVPGSTPPTSHTRQQLFFTDGDELRFNDTRKFGRLYLVQNPQEVLGQLGPEPLEPTFTPERLAQRLVGKKRVLKPLLLDQTFVAGIGNIYADEALFYAQILPTRSSETLTTEEITRLHQAIQHVLQLGINREGASIDSYIKPDGTKGDMQNAVLVFQRTNFPCYTCATPISRTVLGGRSTHFCPTCQK